VQFQAFIRDKDPSAVHQWPLDLTLTIEFLAPVVPISDTATRTSGISDPSSDDVTPSTITKDAPIVVGAIAPAYKIIAGQSTELKFDFADPLVVSPTQEGASSNLDL